MWVTRDAGDVGQHYMVSHVHPGERSGDIWVPHTSKRYFVLPDEFESAHPDLPKLDPGEGPVEVRLVVVEKSKCG